MLDNLQECYRLLDVEPDASLEEVKRSYRELVKVWHPDRFANDPSLQAKAQEKLKQINLAYERLCEAKGVESHSKPARAEPPQSEAKATAAPSSSSGPSGFRDEPRPSQSAGAHQPSVFLRVAGVFVILVLARAVWFANLQQAPTLSQPLKAHARERLTIAEIAAAHQEVLKVQPDLGMNLQEFSRYAQTNQTDYDFSEGFSHSEVLVGPRSATAADGRMTQSSPALPDEPNQSLGNTSAKGYFDVGATKDDVLAIQGNPDGANENTLTYGISKVFFENGKVVSWKAYPSCPLKVKPPLDLSRPPR
ncbi:MAG: heat shock protein DnaJ domain protein [Limisphaerales bacterium]|nr:MAG: heat shock protein DnaJ domain protein [Limisphaerales bacterium]KAG0508884.1 MAG: heat shock protein DnaJ domain protein [Limisphaerales bacterium]TXT50225.1 MAG: heat shock protein DnaJ domain protein [Limisphaerales bacterium]